MSTTQYIPTIGLEVHCQVKTKSKMFCGCATGFGHEPNTNTCPTCLGLPGALPTLNEAAIRKTILTGLMLECETPPTSKWDRKNYFYPDMPKNYQTSQFDLPLCLGGEVPLYDHNYPKDTQKNIPHPGKKIPLTRIHLEEDVAKSTHLSNASLIDFNRAGTPLMEIVSDPDIETAEEAFSYLKTLQQILIYGGISDADMEKGQLRCDVNISVRPQGQKELGAKIELKNLNSISAVRRSIHYEINRQIDELERGIPQIQSTRRWDDDLGESQLMRTKEDAHDYRYFPCPDLLPVRTESYLQEAKAHIPELPHQKAKRFEQDYGLTTYDASVLTSDKPLAQYFEQTATASKAPAKKAANWIINNFLALIKEKDTKTAQAPITPETTAALLNLVESGQLSNNQAQEVFLALWEQPSKNPTDLAKEMGYEPVDTSALDGIIDGVIAENPGKVAEIQAGNQKLLNFLTGQVMKASKGKANPKLVTETLHQKLLK